MEQIENRVLRLEERYAEVDKKVAVFSEIQENANKVQGETARALENLNKTMIEMQFAMIKLQGEVALLTNEFSDIKANVKDESERGKFDILQYLKENLIMIVFMIVILLQHFGAIP